MKKNTLLPVIAGIVLVILVILVVLLTRQGNGSIRIKTRLSPDEVVKKVELTSGSLNFKTEADVYAELSAEEREALKPKPGDYSPKYGKSFTVKEEDIARVLNIDPTKWRIPDRLAFQYENYNATVGLVSGEAPGQDHSDDILYTRRYQAKDNSGFTVIEVALPGRQWIWNDELAGQSAQNVKAVYGSLDSRIGDMPLSVLNCEASSWDRDLEACFIAGNAAYFIRSNVMTQQEFIELLISIYEAPRPVTEDAISALYTVAIAESAAPDPETVRVFSQLLPNNYLFYSEDGGIWCLDHRERQDEGEPERLVVQRYGPVFLPETEDVGDTLSLEITGIRRSEPPASSEKTDWWYLEYAYTVKNRELTAASLSLQIRLDGRWYVLPSGGFTPDEPGLINLMRGRLYPDEAEQIVPGHYRLVLYRDWRGEVSLDAAEFDLVETADGYAVDRIQKLALLREEAYIPQKNILRQDGSGWLMAEAGSQDFWDRMTDTIEAKAK